MSIPLLDVHTPDDTWRLVRTATDAFCLYLMQCDKLPELRAQDLSVLLKFMDLRDAHLRHTGCGNSLVAPSYTFAVDIFCVGVMCRRSASFEALEAVRQRNHLSPNDVLRRAREALTGIDGREPFADPDPHLRPVDNWCEI